MSGSIIDVLENVLSEPRQGEPAWADYQDEELDLAAFVDELGKTAEALDKVAEALPTDPALLSKNLRLLDNPFNIDRGEVYDDHRNFVSKVLPQAKSSHRIPGSVSDIQKKASMSSGSSLARRILG